MRRHKIPFHLQEFFHINIPKPVAVLLPAWALIVLLARTPIPMEVHPPPPPQMVKQQPPFLDMALLILQFPLQQPARVLSVRPMAQVSLSLLPVPPAAALVDPAAALAEAPAASLGIAALVVAVVGWSVIAVGRAALLGVVPA